MILKSLIFLYWHILLNEYRKKFFSKNTLFGVVIVVFISIVVLSFGYFLGLLVNYSRMYPELDVGDPFYFIRVLFIEVIFLFLLLKISGSRVLKQINLNTLKLFPVTKSIVFLFDINIGLLDFVSLFFTEFLLAFILSTGAFSISFSTGIIFVLFIISLVYFVNVLGELLQSIIKLLSSLPKIRTTIVLVIFMVVIYFFAIEHLEWKPLVINNPFSWNVGSIFSLTILKEIHWLYNVIFLNTLFSIFCSLLAISIKIIHANLFSAHIIIKRISHKKSKIQLNSLLSFFPKMLQPYLEKDIKYIYRSSRSLSAIIFELIFLVFVCYMYFTNSKYYDTVYFSAGFIITIPVLMWDFFLSNSWGLERRGFGFYLYSNIDFGKLPQSKNLGYIIARLPIMILISLTLSIIYSFKYFPVIISLYIILNLLSLSFSNIVSVKNPIPIEFKESSLAEKKQQKISWLGFAGLLIYIVLPVLILFILYKIDTGIIFYSILLAILFMLIILYLKMTHYASRLLYKQKETIYKKLIKT